MAPKPGTHYLCPTVVCVQPLQIDPKAKTIDKDAMCTSHAQKSKMEAMLRRQ